MVDRKLYEQVNKILEMLGGKWNRKSQGHLFKEDPNPLIENVLLTGTIAKPEKFGYFPTPQLLAKQVVVKADISDGMTILEPSAGSGNLADIIAGLTAKENIYCCELQESNVALLEEKGYQVRSGDFQSVPPLPEFEVDRVVMNPPFERQQDIKHVMHAWNFVKPGGKLVAIMSSSFTFRANSLSSDFRDFVDEYGHHCENPEGSFKASGTNVNTVTVVLDKPLSYREMLKAA
jgi:predicted RNA methylase